MEKLNLKPDPQLELAPGRTAFDYAVAAAKAGGLVFPFFGAGVTLFDVVTAPLRGKRFSDWCEELRLRLNDLSQKVEGLSPESLAKDDAFVSAFAQATQSALRAHQQEKLEALRNAVLNVATKRAPSEDLQLIFLNLVDSFTPTHLKAMYFFQRPDGDTRDDFRRQGDLADQVVRDLNNRGLINDTRPYIARNRDTHESLFYYEWVVTNLGQQFLDFIKSPEAEKA